MANFINRTLEAYVCVLKVYNKADDTITSENVTYFVKDTKGKTPEDRVINKFEGENPDRKVLMIIDLVTKGLKATATIEDFLSVATITE